jgi:hypothetical protein
VTLNHRLCPRTFPPPSHCPVKPSQPSKGIPMDKKCEDDCIRDWLTYTDPSRTASRLIVAWGVCTVTILSMAMTAIVIGNYPYASIPPYLPYYSTSAPPSHLPACIILIFLLPRVRPLQRSAHVQASLGKSKQPRSHPSVQTPRECRLVLGRQIPANQEWLRIFSSRQ